jgi:hypothetical protein
MAYERLDEALRQLKVDRQRKEATEKQRIKAGAEARMRFARIKSAVIGPIFNEVVARVAAEGLRGNGGRTKRRLWSNFPQREFIGR